MESPIEIFIFGPELPSITFGSRLPYSHLNSLSFFSPLSFYPPFSWREGHGEFTFHKRLWHVIKLWIVAMFRAPPHILSGKCVPYCGIDFVAGDILSPFCMEFGKLIRRRWQRQNWQRRQNHLFTQFSPVSGFQSSALLSPSSFWHSPGSAGVISGVERLLYHWLSVSFPFPVAVMLKIAWRGTEWLVAANNYI